MEIVCKEESTESLIRASASPEQDAEDLAEAWTCRKDEVTAGQEAVQEGRHRQLEQTVLLAALTSWPSSRSRAQEKPVPPALASLCRPLPSRAPPLHPSNESQLRTGQHSPGNQCGYHV